MKFYSHRTILLLLTLALVGSVCGCGQKGKLVLPVRPPSISTPYPTKQAEQAEQEQSDAEQKELPAADQQSKPDPAAPAAAPDQSPVQSPGAH